MPLVLKGKQQMFFNETCGSGGGEVLVREGKSKYNWTEGQRVQKVVGCFQTSEV